MPTLRHERVPLTNSEEVVTIRQRAREFALDARLTLVDQTKLITAASELARNMVVYGGGGVVTLEHVEAEGRIGVRIRFEDKGPGIHDVSLALRDGFTTGGGVGLGLGGAKRLVHDFDLQSQPGQGTTVVITRWK